MSNRSVPLIRRADDVEVEAIVVSGMSSVDLILIERDWREAKDAIIDELVSRSVDPEKWPQSLHWDWARKASELALLEATAFGISLDDKWQGAMVTKVASYSSRLGDDKGKPIVYIDYVETAPWNWNVTALGRDGRYRGVGVTLVREAIEQSLKEGFHGRVGLHALPQAEPFYERVCGMTPVGRDTNKQELLYFELSRGQAQKFLD